MEVVTSALYRLDNELDTTNHSDDTYIHTSTAAYSLLFDATSFHVLKNVNHICFIHSYGKTPHKLSYMVTLPFIIIRSRVSQMLAYCYSSQGVDLHTMSS